MRLTHITAAAFIASSVALSETVAGIATAQSISATAGLAVAKSIADSICGAATAKSAVPGKVPEVSGVKVEGHFVQ